MRSLAILFIIAMCAISPALAEVTACDVLLTKDVEKAVGRVRAVRGERTEVCAGLCFSINGSRCEFDAWPAGSDHGAKVQIDLDLPPFLMRDEDLRRLTLLDSHTDGSREDFRDVSDFGDVAVWDFKNSKDGAEGYLSAYRQGTYYIFIRVSGVDGEDRTFATVKSLAHVALDRFAQLPKNERTGAHTSGAVR